jgi:tetratricopeptide (TPR) repeat protein
MIRPRLGHISGTSRPGPSIIRTGSLGLLLLCAGWPGGWIAPTAAAGQAEMPPQTLRLPPDALLHSLQELDQLLHLENLPRAESLLQTLIQRGARRQDLLPRAIKLAQLQKDHAKAVILCREALATQPRSARMWRELATSLIALDRFAEAAEALDAFIQNSPEQRTGMIVAVELWQQSGHPEEALALCDTVRQRLSDPRFLSRWRAGCLITLDRQAEAADELVMELRANPLNFPLIRADLAELDLAPETAGRLLAGLSRRRSEPGAVPEELLLVASLQLQRGATDAAIATVAPLLETRTGCLNLLQMAGYVAKGSGLIEDKERRRVHARFLISILESLATGDNLERGLRPRVLDMLAQACEDALADDVLASDPEAAVAQLERVLGLVKEGSPASPHLYAAQIHLAHYTRDVLRRPAEAAARLERLLVDLDLPLEGVALSRLTLGECYLAAGDTARGREVLTRLGRGSQFREAAGHAHYDLARLDLAQGQWPTARDRFAVVAMDNPLADYANDALELGLAIAEELDNPTGGPRILEAYARSVYYDLTAQPDSQAAALRDFITFASAELDLTQPQHLLERCRFELARLAWRLGDWQTAVQECERIVLDHPAGRYPPEALVLEGRIWEERGAWDRARQAYERLLQQYPEHLFADDIREQIRSLP